MDIFTQQLERAKTIDTDVISKELFDFIKAIREEIINLNRNQIYEKSEDIYGNAIGFYSKATEIITRGSKKAGEPFDGKDTGSFLKNFYVSVVDNTLYFGSSDSKTKDILDSPNWLSHSLFGLTDENLNKVIQEKIYPFLMQQYAKKLGI